MLVQEYLKNKEYLRSKDKAKKIIRCIKTYIIAYAKIQKNEDILSSMAHLQPNWCLKTDFQKVDQHAGGRWLIHDTKRRKDDQLQSLKLPCRISKKAEMQLLILNWVYTWNGNISCHFLIVFVGLIAVYSGTLITLLKIIFTKPSFFHSTVTLIAAFSIWIL